MCEHTKFIKFLLLTLSLTTITLAYPNTIFSQEFFNKKKIQQNLYNTIQQKYIHEKFQKSIIESINSILQKIEEKNLPNFNTTKYQKIIYYHAHTILQSYLKYNNTPTLNIQSNNSLFIDKPKNLQVKETLLVYANNINILLYNIKSTTFYIKKIFDKNPSKITIFNHNQYNDDNYKKFLHINNLSFIETNHYLKNKIEMLSDASYSYIPKKIKKNNIHFEYISSQNTNTLPQCIKKQQNINYNLSTILAQQTNYTHDISLKQQEATSHVLQVHQALINLTEQAQWINKSPALGETLRFQISKLPSIPNSQKLDHDMAQLRAKRLQYATQIHKIPLILLQSKQDNGDPLTASQKKILETQLITQNTLINTLLNSYDYQILELTKLKISYEQLKHVLQEVQKATHRYLFWVANIQPITLSYPIDVYQDLNKLFTENIYKQEIKSALHTIFHDQNILIFITFSIIISIGLYFSLYYRYQKFLHQSSKYIGKVHQDNFSLTFHNVWSSILIALPIPILWNAIGYSLNHAWNYPIAIAIGNAICSTTFILWFFIISSYFATTQGLFIAHFGWQKKKIQKVFSRYYTISAGIIIFLIITFNFCNNYNDQEFLNTLGRLCFILLCIYVAYITNNLKKSGLPLYINKHDSSNNIINYSLWNIMIFAPIVAIFSCIYGYLFAAWELLSRLETSLFIWITLLIIYHIIRRWISIQRRRIALERAKQKRAKQLALRIHKQSSYLFNNNQNCNTPMFINKNEKKTLDLDSINTQSLQLIRSILTLIAIILMTVLWAELKFAFSFLENITLWDVTSTIKGINNIQPITLKSLLIAILVIIITTKTVHNLPAFLQLTLLQYLDLTPGTGYAIVTLTKYILMLLGGLIGFSLIGIEWSKIQWLIAALGVGLGFGLQEIFANFISGLIILFEKPIRIGDTITIKNLTGNVSRISTRATIITDWDHKEIIIPNKEFITKKFINWSLSDTITRVVLRIPAPIKENPKKISSIFLQIIQKTHLALQTPNPEIYLIDLQHGIPIFEIRMYVSNTKSRIPLCHQVHMLIIEYYQNNKIEIPHIPFYFYHSYPPIAPENSHSNNIINKTKPTDQ